MRWDGDTGTPLLGWQDGGRTRQRVLRYGETLGFRVVGERRCPGVWRGGNQVPCAVGAVVGARAVSDRCEECARLDRARSVAADTYADDPRPYRVYLAWFGRGMVKVGITRADRGPARLLEQGAVAFVWLGTGPLMAARRAEELLRAALGVPDRVPYDRKRAVRADLPGPEVRAAELRALHGVAVALPGWPESLERTPGGCAVVDHGEVFSTAGLPRPRPWSPNCATAESYAGCWWRPPVPTCTFGWMGGLIPPGRPVPLVGLMPPVGPVLPVGPTPLACPMLLVRPTPLAGPMPPGGVALRVPAVGPVGVGPVPVVGGSSCWTVG